MSINLPIVSKFDPKGLRQAQDGLKAFGESSKSVASTAAKAFGAVSIAAGAAATGLIISSVKAFGELEQNLGGSEAVFGKYAFDLQDTAMAAFKNMGISQSEYLATANKMGSLFQGSGIEQVKALDMTEEAMQRAADMASVMGIDMSVAMESVAGAAKGNFTMMDNLGVAMNATSIEAYAASQGMTDFSFATASSAEKAEMAMQMFLDRTQQYAGNFARESTETISGSLGMLQASASDLLAGLGNVDADIQQMGVNVVEAFDAVIKNVVPIIENIADALPWAIQSMVESAQPLIESLTEVIVGLIPTIIDAGIGLIEALLQGIMQALPDLISVLPEVVLSMAEAISDLLPMLIEAGVEAILALSDGILNTVPMLIPLLVDGLLKAIDALIGALPDLLYAGISIIIALLDGLSTAMPMLMEALPGIIDALLEFLIDALPEIIDIGLRLFLALVGALPQIITGIVGVLPEIIGGLIGAILSALPLLIDAGIELFLAIVGALPEIIVGIVGAIPQIITSILVAVLDSLPMLIEAGLKLFVALIGALPEIIVAIVGAIPEIITAIVGAIIESVPQLIAAGSDLIKGLWQGIKDMGAWLREKISGFFGGVVDDIKDFFGIRSPSKVFAEMGKNLGRGMAEGIVSSTKDVQQAMNGMMAASSGTVPAMNATMRMSSMGVGALGTAGGGGAGVAGGKRVYNINVNAGMGANGKQLGEQIVTAIKRYERTSGPVFASA